MKTVPNSKPTLYVPGVQLVELAQREWSRKNTVWNPEQADYKAVLALFSYSKPV